METHRQREAPLLHQSLDDGPVMFAGIRDTWRNRGGVITCAIITTTANELVGELHNRMPAILSPKALQMWGRPKN